MTPEKAAEALLAIEVDASNTARAALILRTALQVDPDALDGVRIARRIAYLEADAETSREEVLLVVAAVRRPWWRRFGKILGF